MRKNIKHFPVNWIDGMKINKDHFIAQDNATADALHDTAALNLSPLKYGIVPPSAAGEDNFNVKISLDNQNSLRATVLSVQAITPGGVRINIPALSLPGQQETDGVPATSFQFSPSAGETSYWVVLTVNPAERRPAGSPDLAEKPPRYPNALPTYQVQVIPGNQYPQFAQHPFSIMIGKVTVNGSQVRVEEEYIPPCVSVSAHPDLIALHAELDQFLSSLELRSSQIVQKIFKKSQQNELSDLVLFLCDRVILYLSQAITSHRWLLVHDSPAALLANVVGLARVMKNTIDLRVGSGKDELMNYLSEWCELKQGELEGMLSNLANLRFDNNDLNKDIQKIAQFVRITGKLFETLSNLEFIGKRKESGIFVKEEQISSPSASQDQPKAKRRFFG
jgi:hypothetical protein